MRGAERVYGFVGLWVLGLSGFKRFQFRGTGAADSLEEGSRHGVFTQLPKGFRLFLGEDDAGKLGFIGDCFLGFGPRRPKT